jgi:hypothetical protein
MEENKGILNVLDGLNLPKHILQKSEKLLVTLFGPSMHEVGGMLADQVRYRRFNNQIAILEKAQKFVEEKGIKPRSLDLKILAPIVEYSSLEENINIQEMWASLIANVLTEDRTVRIEKKCVNILSNISIDEAIFFKNLYSIAEEKREAKVLNLSIKAKTQRKIDNAKKIPITKTYLPLTIIYEKTGIDKVDSGILIESLVSLEIVKWDVPSVDVSAEKTFDDPDDLSVDVDLTLDDPDGIYITNLGSEFVTICSVNK